MFRNQILFAILSFVSLVLCVAETNAQDKAASPDELAFFEAKIRPALIKYCYQCHSLEEGDSRGGLLVDTREALLQGGDAGPAIVPGSLDESPFWEAISWDGIEMPPSDMMPDEVIEDFKTWIEMGAPDPRVRKTIKFSTKISTEDIEKGKQHWAFQKPKSAAGFSIDQLVNEKLAESKLKPVGPADANTMLRRLSYDLIGLPPTPAEIQAFNRAWETNSATAIESKVDELLARPQYGERWARHWLDIARYADTSGNVNVSFPHAWRYRNYVIDSFNDDTPYDQFVTEQLAGDLLPAANKERWQENLIATGFLAVGMKRLDEKNPRKFQADLVDEQINTVSQAILGVTVACARCHDHKTDPIPTTDYYAMAGIFRSTNTLYGTVFGKQNHRPADLILLPILDPTQKSGQSIADIEKQLEALSVKRRQERAAAQKSGEKNQRKFVTMRNTDAKLRGLLATLNPDGTKKTYGMGTQDNDKMVNANVLVGGDVDRPAQEVERGFLQVLSEIETPKIPENASGRRELAAWMTSTDNPLTARVMVNRIWSHLLGSPLVKTPNNFGSTGMEAANQELLDHLAVSFMQNNWSVKTMIRQIVISQAYQRSSTFSQLNFDLDPYNDFHWRFSPKPIDAEALRDSMLVIGGVLEMDRPARSKIADAGDGRLGRDIDESSFNNHDNRNRSVYLPIIRDKLHEALNLFDFPDPNNTSSGRTESIVPTQALFMMNSSFVMERAAGMAIEMSSQGSANEQVAWAFLKAYGREATDKEIQASIAYIRKISPPKNFVESNSQATNNSASSRRGRRGQGGNEQNGQNGRRGGRQAQSSPEKTASSGLSLTADQGRLAVFCQALLGSAEYRILN